MLQGQGQKDKIIVIFKHLGTKTDVLWRKNAYFKVKKKEISQFLAKRSMNQLIIQNLIQN